MGMIKKLIETNLNSTVYVKSLEIGGSLVRDYESSYFIHPQKQVRSRSLNGSKETKKNGQGQLAVSCCDKHDDGETYAFLIRRYKMLVTR